MLILSRKLEESIIIRDDIIITVLAIEGDKVKLGIRAPRDVQVYRDELWQAIQEQNQIVEKLAQAEAIPGFENLRAYLVEELKNAGVEELPNESELSDSAGSAADAVDVSQDLGDYSV